MDGVSAGACDEGLADPAGPHVERKEDVVDVKKQKGYECYKSGGWDKAVKCYTETIKLNPYDAKMGEEI